MALLAVRGKIPLTTQIRKKRVHAFPSGCFYEKSREKSPNHRQQAFDSRVGGKIAPNLGISPQTAVDYPSSRQDQGTFGVAEEFIRYARGNNINTGTVIILAHRHHHERCRLVLERLGVNGLRYGDPYEGYDEEEAQPRVMSPEEYIVNDFSSMAGMLGPR